MSTRSDTGELSFKPTQGPRQTSRHRTGGMMVLLGAFVCMIFPCGCASYQFGRDALFPNRIRTIHIPMVRNETYRHDLGPRLTEALVEEVERQTPYKVVGDPNADSVLTCNLTYQTKVVLSESSNDDPRALDTAINVAADWTSRNGQRLMQNSFANQDSDVKGVGFSQSSRFVPEAGQSIDTANQEAVTKLARRIVSQMEYRW